MVKYTYFFYKFEALECFKIHMNDAKYRIFKGVKSLIDDNSSKYVWTCSKKLF